ncbi:high-affinity Fe2+/Pb2+ permease [Galactobacter valiniphilus]|uniref:High-affinity Fe2+/Pb2+ permease n=1 Tax=Galactobacter valiniphilus TaxID=2676122 RepID=A0A399JM59_9MICC|nr:iron uptake transporter permease EfeU [Galactobacter valiniphilus]RII43686.1 high-affinity Fe2+/Pb2+ permease [Galactobacter valiniphilus]
MLGNYIIGLREGLEAALVVVVLMAYLGKSGRAHLKPRVWAGIALAILVSVGFGALLTFGPRGLTFQAQEAIGGGLSLIAVGFVTWMIFWMGKASHNISAELKSKVDSAVERPSGTGWALVVLGAVSVGREGLETALFVWANANVGGGGTGVATLGAVLGILTAVVLGVLLNRGAVKLNLSSFFTWTTYFLVFVAAGVFAYAVTDLQEAGFLPGIHDYAFDISAWALTVDPNGIGIAIVKAIFQLTPAMSKLAFGAWLLYLAVMLPICIWRHRQMIAGRKAREAQKAAAQAALTTPAASVAA